MKVRKTAYAIVAALLAVVLLRCFVATPYLIPSVGMENSLYRGERILVNKWSYGLRLPFMAWWGYHRWPDRPVKQGDIVVFNNPGNLSQPVVDRRETFISRCIGTPGDTLLIDSLFDVVPDMPQAIVHKPKPLIVPGRGATLRVYPWNRTLLCNTLVLHEGKRAEIKGDTLFVEGKPVHFCRFSKDYYWVTGRRHRPVQRLPLGADVDAGTITTTSLTHVSWNSTTPSIFHRPTWHPYNIIAS